MINEEKFLARYKQLNKEQKEAVDTVYGPVMVIAGPGTGKTEILSLRIVNILRTEKDLKPSDIVALTFTESGVCAMQKRLFNLIGNDAYKVQIYTFHSFCNLIITEYPEEFLFSGQIRLVTDLEKNVIIKEIIDSMPTNTLRPFGDKYLYLSTILNKIKLLKQEAITPKNFEEAISKQKANLEKTPEDEMFHQKGRYKGQKKKIYVEKEHNLKKQESLLFAYTKYLEIMREKNLYDFEDMIMFVVEKFTSTPSFLQIFQEDIKFILVDEYQDTNNAQNTIIEKLIEGLDNPNIFVVGDDDQAIYRFQGASMENFLFFHKAHKNIQIIQLKQNYRSTQTIINGALSLIEYNKSRITCLLPDIEKMFESNNKSEEFPITLAELPNETSEYYYIKEKIMELHNKNNVPYSDIAVLYRNNRNALPLIDILQKEKIPFSLSQDVNALDNFFVKQLIYLLKVLHNPLRDDLLFQFLYAGFIPIAKEDIFRLTKYSFGNRTTMINVMEKLTGIAGLTEETTKSITNAKDILVKLKKLSYLAPAKIDFKTFAMNVLTSTGIIKKMMQKKEPVNDWIQMRSFIKWLENQITLKKSYGLNDFINDIEVIEQTNLQIPAEAASQAVAGVHLMTAHKAKGLEFPFVFYIRCHSKNLESKRSVDKLKLPSNLILKNDIADDSNKIEEERRLFYVAATRAKEKLYLTYAAANDKNEPLNPSVFLTETSAEFIEQERTDNYVEMRQTDMMHLFFKETDADTLDESISKDFIKQYTENYVLSPTGLNDYLKCPTYFKYNHIYRIPQAPNRHMALGSAIHNTLEEVFKEAKTNNQMPSLERWIEIYDTFSKKNILAFSEKEDVAQEGLTMLTQYYKNYDGSFHIDCALEYDFSSKNVFLEDVPLTGKIDKIEFLPEGTINVIDYKTGKPKSDNEIKGLNKNSSPDYYQQLIFYKILCELDTDLNNKVHKAVLDFVRPKKDKGEFVKSEFEITSEETDDFKKTIINAYKGIKALDFKPTADDSCCKSYNKECQFIDICEKYTGK